MIARIWHGWTRPDDADAYASLLRTTVLPDIAAQQIPGYRGADLLRRVPVEASRPSDTGPEVEFVTLLWFDSLENVQAFTGSDYEAAHVPPEARRLLARFDARSAHYDWVLQNGREYPATGSG